MPRDKDENGDGGKTENVKPADPQAQLLAQVLAQNADLMQSFAGAMQQMAANQPTKVITPDSPEYQEMLKAQGFYDSFPRPVYQNGKEADARGLSVETRERAANLKPGKYLGGKMTVDATNDGGIHLKYKSRTVEERMQAPANIPFPELIDKIWAEMQHSLTAV